MSRQVYQLKHYRVYKCARYGYLVHNCRKPFDEGHTHISNFGTAKYVATLALYQNIPKRISDYLLESLIRVSTDPCYIEALQMRLESQRSKHEQNRSTE